MNTVTHIRDESELVVSAAQLSRFDWPAIATYCLRFVISENPTITVADSRKPMAADRPRLCLGCRRFRDNRRYAADVLALKVRSHPGYPCPSCGVTHAPAG